MVILCMELVLWWIVWQVSLVDFVWKVSFRRFVSGHFWVTCIRGDNICNNIIQAYWGFQSSEGVWGA